MNSRERLSRCYCNRELDRPGVYSRTGFPTDDPSYDALKALLRDKSDLKVTWSSPALDSALPTDSYTEEHSEDFQRRVTILHTPAGDLRATYLVSLKGQPGMRETHLIKNRADAEKYFSLPPRRVAGDAGSFFQADRELGDLGIVEAGLGHNPAGRAVELVGSEAFAIMSVTDRDIVHELCRREMETMLKRVEFLLARGVGPFFAMLGEEYVVPPMHSPADFHDFNVKYDKPILDRIHAAGGRMHVHCHGAVRTVFDGFLEMGVDVLHPFEAPPMGDITAAQAKDLARGKLCLEGNIQIADMYENSPQDIRRQTEALIESAFDDHKGLIVCPTASPYIRGAGQQCLPMYQAMIDTVTGWGR